MSIDYPLGWEWNISSSTLWILDSVDIFPKRTISILELTDKNTTWWFYPNLMIQKIWEFISEYIRNIWVSDYEILSVWKTWKSIYWKIMIRWKSFFYKISSPISIKRELEWYELCKNWQHNKVLDCYISTNFWIYIQDFFDNPNFWASLLEDTSNIITGLNKDLEWFLWNVKSLFRSIWFNYSNSLQKFSVEWENDIFFNQRLVWDESYLKQYLWISLIDDLGQVKTFRELLWKRIVLNWIDVWLTLWWLIFFTSKTLGKSGNRLSVLSQWDLTENNMTTNWIFFDFETAWLNSLSQDMAITLYALFIWSHHITFKYSSSIKSLNIDFWLLRKEIWEPNTKCKFSNDEVLIDISYLPHKVKDLMLWIYLSEVVIPIEAKINELLDIDKSRLLEELKAALICRTLFSKKLTEVTSNSDIILLLWISAYFFQYDWELTLNYYIKDKFFSNYD